ncbi:helicase-related protein [Methylobacterium gnaphalii]|uniref:Transcription-repair-coupling factor n=2 Tax=Methylobacterium gnaphalii TaxID=1010610 RepID=A0A512JIJ0_9HYPH|nr:helicase-related protein [Methylobacterium gnaphalii]GEP09770.1 transcription-repair-coupling factor [Methylobacterium gnaphalii]GLS49800.1 transcription-repair-coupling factor [Methylobacterium gnaphalii]
MRVSDAPLPLSPEGALAAALLDHSRPAQPLIHVASDRRRLDRIAAALAAFAPDTPYALLPEWDCLPFDRVSPSRAAMGVRTGVLRWLTDTKNLPRIVLTTPPALIQRVPPPETWTDAHLEFRAGDEIVPERVIAALQRMGYVLDERVDEPGEMAIRGQVIDLFTAAAPMPCRIEMDDGRVVGIRSYDPVSQLSLNEADVLVVDPATEIILPPDLETALEPFTGQEHALGRFYPRLVTVLDYLPDTLLVVESGVHERAEAFFEQIAEGRDGAGGNAAVPLPGGLYLTPDEWSELLGSRTVRPAEATEDVSVPDFARDRRPGPAFVSYLGERQEAGDRIVLASARSALRRLARPAVSALGRKLQRAASWEAVLAAEPGSVLAMEAPLEAGFRVPEAGVTVIAAADLLGATTTTEAVSQTTALPLGDVELQLGDVAIHEDHGLCVFEGVECVAGAGACEEDAIRLRFADDAVLMEPASRADRLWRYGSETEVVSLDRLGGKTWGKRRAGVEEALVVSAQVMLETAQARARAEAPALTPPASKMERFAASFGFPLTPDQARAIDAVLNDLSSGRPMNRLVCGDVGFGKTEVALRAAAAALFAGKQVAIAAPTTVLVRQHVQTFKRRLARFGIEVEELSRLVPPAEAKRVKAGLADGSVRVVVGTHALAGRGVRFADLGLLVIDEEQRFGTGLKERLRRTGHGTHTLTLTATPIPRTLQTALVGLQDLSVIATPPVVRQPIRTVLTPFLPETARAALLRERRRGGRSFVVCPRIADLEPMRERLREIAPELTVLVAHGDLDSAEMDAVMMRFADGEGDVLLATNIIESGLDIPGANTMLVWRPEKFGLSQLHQLRGRVGRGQRRAAFYLLSDGSKPLTKQGEKRLRTLEALDRLGAGFAISARDLDLRGAGDLVGEDQAGHVRLIGLGLYQHLLDGALKTARGEPSDDWRPEIRLGLSGRIPESYVPEPELRLSLYTRLARLRGREEVEALRDEIEDRFGPLPESTEQLVTIAGLRTRCIALGITCLSGGPQGVAADILPGVLDRLALPERSLTIRDGRVITKEGGEDAAACARLALALLDTLEGASDDQTRRAA